VNNRILLELIQGEHREIVGEQLSRVNDISSYDPRIFRYQRAITLTPQFLARFPGPGTLRLTGFGAQKLLQTPAPKVRTLQCVSNSDSPPDRDGRLAENAGSPAGYACSGSGKSCSPTENACSAIGSACSVVENACSAIGSARSAIANGVSALADTRSPVGNVRSLVGSAGSAVVSACN
jgi:hypothetical protein